MMKTYEWSIPIARRPPAKGDTRDQQERDCAAGGEDCVVISLERDGHLLGARVGSVADDDVEEKVRLMWARKFGGDNLEGT